MLNSNTLIISRNHGMSFAESWGQTIVLRGTANISCKCSKLSGRESLREFSEYSSTRRKPLRVFWHRRWPNPILNRAYELGRFGQFGLGRFPCVTVLETRLTSCCTELCCGEKTQMINKICSKFQFDYFWYKTRVCAWECVLKQWLSFSLQYTGHVQEIANANERCEWLHVVWMRLSCERVLALSLCKSWVANATTWFSSSHDFYSCICVLLSYWSARSILNKSVIYLRSVRFGHWCRDKNLCCGPGASRSKVKQGCLPHIEVYNGNGLRLLPRSSCFEVICCGSMCAFFNGGFLFF